MKTQDLGPWTHRPRVQDPGLRPGTPGSRARETKRRTQKARPQDPRLRSDMGPLDQLPNIYSDML